MDEKKVREAIYCMKSFADDTVCEECDNYDRCDHTMVADNANTAIEALEKQLPKKVEIKKWCPSVCPACGCELSENIGDGYDKHPIFLNRCPNPDCGQKLDWSEYELCIDDSLISRRALIKTICEGYDLRYENYPLTNLLDCIERQPTAYDVEKVAEKLDDYLFDTYCIEGDMKIYEIIRSGGINE